MFSYNLFEQGSDRMLAVCDDDIIGKSFDTGDIEITVSEFYAGKKAGEKEILDIARRSTIINAVGNGIVSLLIKNGLVESSSVLDIGGVKHAQVVSVV